MRWESVKEGVLLALDQLRVYRLRSALTILGLVVGVATVMVMSALIAGVRASIVGEIEAAGPKNFIVARFDPSEVRIVVGGAEPPWARNPPLTVEEARAIARLDRVRAAIVDFDLTVTVEAERGRPAPATLARLSLAANFAAAGALRAGGIVAPLGGMALNQRADEAGRAWRDLQTAGQHGAIRPTVLAGRGAELLAD